MRGADSTPLPRISIVDPRRALARFLALMARPWLAALVLPLALVAGGLRGAHAGSVGDELRRYYASKAGYRAVKADVLRWHKTTRNGCVAFASTALRHVGVEIGERDTIDGEGISRI